MDGRLEKEYEPEFTAWQKTPDRQTTGLLLKKLSPAIDRGISAHVGTNPGPSIRSHARRLALQAVRSYDPIQARLGTHVINNLQGLKRIARKQQQIIHIPERVSLDQAHLHRASADLEDILGRDPSASELADHTGLSLQRIARIRQAKNPMAEGSFLQMTSADQGGGYSPSVDSSSDDIVLRAVYDDLDPINQKIVDWTLGRHGEKQLSNQQIAAKLRISPGAISQRRALIQQRLAEMEGMF